MDEKMLRDMLDRATSDEPPLGPVVDNAVRTGTRVRRRRIVLGATGCVAAVALIATAVPVLNHVLSVRPAPSVARTIGPSGLVVTPSPGLVVTPTPGHGTEPGAVRPPGRSSGRPSPSSSGRVGAPRPGRSPAPVHVLSDGTVFVGTQSGVVPIATGTNRAGKLINVPSYSSAMSAAAMSAGGMSAGGMSAGGMFVEAPDGETLYAINPATQSMTPIDTTTETAEASIPISGTTMAATISPDGSTIYLASSSGSSRSSRSSRSSGGSLLGGLVTPVSTFTGRAEAPIPVPGGGGPRVLAVTPDGTTLYVVNEYGNSVTAISTATGQIERTIHVGQDPDAIAISPDGSTAYVVNSRSDSVTPINVAANTAGRPIRVPSSGGWLGSQIVVTPDGSTAYVLGSDGVVPLNLVTGTAGAPIATGLGSPLSMAMTPSGSTLYVVSASSAFVTPVYVSTNTAGTPIDVGQYANQIAITPDGRTAYVALGASGEGDGVVPVTIATNTPGKEINVGSLPSSIAIAP